MLTKLIPFMVFACLFSVNAKCPKLERLAEDGMWCVDDYVVPNYVFDVRDPSVKIQTKNNGVFKFHLHGVRTAVEKKLGLGEVRAEIIGYDPPSIRDPHRVTIFVGTKERQVILDMNIEKTKKRFSDKCFLCVLSEKSPENHRK